MPGRERYPAACGALTREETPLDVRLKAKLAYGVLLRPRVDRAHAHAEAARNCDDARPDAPGANHGDGLVFEFKAAKIRLIKAPAARALSRINQVSRQPQEQGEDVLGDGRIAIGGDVRHLDPAAAAIGEIDVIDAGRAGGDELQLRQL